MGASEENYYGVRLSIEEVKALNDLEAHLRRRLPKVSRRRDQAVGYKARHNQVIRLGLYNQQLTSLPKSIGQLTNLMELYLGQNQLSTLPESIGQLTNLVCLRLGHNQLNSLSETIGNLKNLERLHMSNTQLEYLPETFGKLKNLQLLDLSWNKLSSLPESLGQLSNLRSLSLIGNRFKQLPETIGELKNITSLILDMNQLTCLPKTFGSLKNLQYLSLEENQLESLPESIGDLTNLQAIFLEGNPPDFKTKIGTILLKTVLSSNPTFRPEITTIPGIGTEIVNVLTQDSQHRPESELWYLFYLLSRTSVSPNDLALLKPLCLSIILTASYSSLSSRLRAHAKRVLGLIEGRDVPLPDEKIMKFRL